MDLPLSAAAFMPTTESYDAIVVGAGLAGLSAACALSGNGLQVLTLEKAERPGGRIRTRRWQNIAYDFGALFAFDPTWTPVAVDVGEPAAAAGTVGLWHAGRLHVGDSVSDCLQGLQPGLRQSLNLASFLRASAPQTAWIGQDLHDALRAFARVIHPADLAPLLPERRFDSLVRHDSRRYPQGNAALVDALATHAGGGLRTGCRVVDLAPSADGSRVRVRWQTAGGATAQAEAGKVVLAVPAAAARRLCAGAGRNVATDFLDRVRFGAGIAVVLLCRGVTLRPFGYVVSTSGSVNTFVFHRVRTDITMVTAYLVAERADAHMAQDDEELAERVRDELNALGIGRVEASEVVFHDVQRWREVGPVIDVHAYGHFSRTALRPMPGVVLAGDYTWCEAERLPYGMRAALASGRRAAELCLREPLPPLRTDFAALPLATTATSRLTDNGPAHQGRFADGTVAYYGLLLAAEAELAAELAPYLIGEAEGELWAYHQGYTVTSLDSALVMEGLLASGGHGRQLERSAERLAEVFFDPAAGAFQTIPLNRRGRAPYWQGIDCPATAACAWLLLRINPQCHRECIASCRRHLLRHQFVGGGWPGKWFPAANIPIWYAVRFLLADGVDEQGDGARAACERAGLALTGAQGEDGSWSGSVIETASAVLALGALQSQGIAGDAERDRGLIWLRAQRQADGWRGEPILEYWFEADGQRTLHTTCDRGRITSAWAKLALAGSARPGVAPAGEAKR